LLANGQFGRRERPETERQMLAKVRREVVEIRRVEPGSPLRHLADDHLIELCVGVVEVAEPGRDQQSGAEHQDRRPHQPDRSAVVTARTGDCARRTRQERRGFTRLQHWSS